MPRRSHHKSRAGCLECKRRHIKCDESRPACGNCSISSRHCSYLLSQPKLPGAAKDSVGSASPGFLRPQSDASTSSQAPSPISPGCEPLTIQDVNMTHMELFFHCTKSRFDLPLLQEAPNNLLAPDLFIDTALSSPFLMNEMLGFAALHLAHLKPAEAPFYKHHAVGLQTQALGLFNREMPGVNRENCHAILVFAWLITLHTLCEITDAADADSFLDRLIHYLKMQRGVRAVASGAWGMMLESKIGQVLRETAKVFETIEPGSHTTELKNYIQNSETLGNDAKEACSHALDRIQWFLSRDDGKERDDSSLGTAFLSLSSWPAIVEADFFRLVCEKVPEALLVLSFYAVPLHRCRNVWMIKNAGQLLIQCIRLHLDERWHRWVDDTEALMNTLP